MALSAVLSYVLVDTMTDGPFMGNPTPVFLLDETLPWLPDNKLQLLAREMNHSESVFLRQIDASGEYDIVFFTPTAEEPFCGHGILGAAYALSEMHRPGKDGFSFRLRNGIVSRAHISGQPASSLPRKLQLGAVREIAMTFPAAPPNPRITLIEPEVKAITGTDIEEGYASALGLEPKQLLYVAVNEYEDVVIELDPSIDISADKMTVDAVALEAESPQDVRSQIITTKSSEEGVDFYKRVFAYGSEDQGTGSTYAALGPYWAEKLGKTQLVAVQPSARGARARLDCSDAEKVVVYAKAMKVAEGQMLVP